MAINVTRIDDNFPHCGRVFLCDDTLGIVDIWEASDAYEYALTNGIQFVTESGKGFNVGNVFSTNNQDGIIRTVPLCGFDGDQAVFVDNPSPSAVAVGELHPSCDSYALQLCFRFLSADDYRRFTPSPYPAWTGQGYRCQRITVYLRNLACANSFVVVLDLFVDLDYYIANVGAVVTGAYTVDLVNGGNLQGMNIGGINNVVVMGQIPADQTIAFSSMGELRVQYWHQLDPDGATWATTAAPLQSFTGLKYAVANLDGVYNPFTGTTSSGAGILSLEFTTFSTLVQRSLTGALAAPTPTNPAGRRIVTAMPTTPIPAMGDVNSAAIHSALWFRGRAAIGASWPAMSIMGSTFGGITRPIVGNFGVFDDSSQEVATFPVQVPNGANWFVLAGIVRNVLTAIGGVHRIRVTLTNSVSAQLLLDTSNVFTATVERYFIENAQLTAPMRPVSGYVELYTLEIRVTKSILRTGIQQPFYWDGVRALYLGFY